MSEPPIPAYPVPARTGRLSWGLGFLAYLPVPVLGLVVAAVAVLVTSRSRRRDADGLVRGNATTAANWALTVLVVLGLCVAWVAVTASIEDFRTAGFFPIGAAVIAYLVLAVAHLVVTIAGTVVAGSRVYRAPVAIPFLR